MLVALAIAVLLQGAPSATPVRPGVVEGLLRNPDGAPATSVRVAALPAPSGTIRPSDGQNYYATIVPSSTTLTDKAGRYRLTNLAPGRYLIMASVLGYPTYYPSATLADEGTVITVGADAPVTGVDVTIALPPGGRVSGTVTQGSAAAGERAILSGLVLGELIETPVGDNGAFTFGHIPAGPYLLSLFPTPPGMPSKVFEVEEGVDTRIDLVRPTLYPVTGRIVVPRGPIPFGLLGFTTEVSYVAGAIAADGTFRAQAQSANHQVEMAGLPIGYRIASITRHGRDVASGIEVTGAGVDGIEITLATPPSLPAVKGRIVGVPPAALKGARVELLGRIISRLEAPVQSDGSFQFAAVAPGTYWVNVPQVPSIAPFFIVAERDDVVLEVK